MSVKIFGIFFFFLTLNLFSSCISNSQNELPIKDDQSFNLNDNDNDIEEGSLSNISTDIVINLFKKFFNINNYPTSDLSLTCSTCKLNLLILKNTMLYLYEKIDLKKFMEELCVSILNQGEDTCKGIVENYGDILAESLINMALDSTKLCNYFKLCNDKIQYITIESYAQRVLKDKPEFFKNKDQSEKLSLDIFKVAHVTDIHLDINYKEGSIVNCGKFLCCHDLPPENSTTDYTLAGYYGASGSCDGAPKMMEEFANKILELKPDYIMLTGDNVAHNFWVSVDELLTGNKYIVDQIVSKTGYDIPIFPSLGNHEGVPASEFYENGKEILKGLSEIFKPFLTWEAYLEFKKYGYYSQLYKDTNLRIVSMNSLICDSFNFHLLYDTSAPYEMFKWLENVLNESESKGEKVHILHHFPMQDSRHSIQCAKRLKILMDRYQDTITGYFSGHMHAEYISIISEYYSSKPIHVNFIASPLTSGGSINPSFRIYDIDSNTKEVRDFIQYRFNITEANKEKLPKWFESYTATSLYNVNDLSNVEEMSNIEVEGDYIIKMYTDTESGKNAAHNQGVIKATKCNLQYDSIEDVMECKGEKPSISPYYAYYILSRMMDNWEEK